MGDSLLVINSDTKMGQFGDINRYKIAYLLINFTFPYILNVYLSIFCMNFVLIGQYCLILGFHE